jgi:hypothetical protein
VLPDIYRRQLRDYPHVRAFMQHNGRRAELLMADAG